jgi:hypothetical protein
MIVHKLSMPSLTTNINQNPFGSRIQEGFNVKANHPPKGFIFSLVAVMALRVCEHLSKEGLQ